MNKTMTQCIRAVIHKLRISRGELCAADAHTHFRSLSFQIKRNTLNFVNKCDGVPCRSLLSRCFSKQHGQFMSLSNVLSTLSDVGIHALQELEHLAVGRQDQGRIFGNDELVRLHRPSELVKSY